MVTKPITTVELHSTCSGMSRLKGKEVLVYFIFIGCQWRVLAASYFPLAVPGNETVFTVARSCELEYRQGDLGDIQIRSDAIIITQQRCS